MAAISLHISTPQLQNVPEFQYLHVRITADTGIIQASDLKDVQLPPNMNWRQGVVIEGKAPIWLYGYLIHACHVAAWVACYDPRLGAVVVATHSPVISVGTILDVHPQELT